MLTAPIIPLLECLSALAFPFWNDQGPQLSHFWNPYGPYHFLLASRRTRAFPFLESLAFSSAFVTSFIAILLRGGSLQRGPCHPLRDGRLSKKGNDWGSLRASKKATIELPRVPWGFYGRQLWRPCMVNGAPISSCLVPIVIPT